MTILPVAITGSKDPLLTTMDEGVGYREEKCEKRSEREDM